GQARAAAAQRLARRVGAAGRTATAADAAAGTAREARVGPHRRGRRSRERACGRARELLHRPGRRLVRTAASDGRDHARARRDVPGPARRARPAGGGRLMGFLDAYRVVDFTNERGLLAGRMLADLGADVIQVEPPDGSSARRVGPFAPDGESLYWDAYARNKRGVTCDLDEPDGRELALRLCSDADFVFESEMPGVMDARGLAYADVRAVNPRVVYTSITPFGSDGPKARYADAELILWASGGPLYARRDGDRAPLRISV